MGSSKKHKEKDREHKRKKHKRSRSRSRSREKKSRRHHSPEAYSNNYAREERQPQSESQRDRYAATNSGDFQQYSDYRDRPPPQMKTQQEEAGDADFGKEQLNLSIEETNKLRAKLGLKPLEVPGSNDDSSKSKENQDVHVPAINLSEKQRTEKIRERTKTMQDKRKVNQKLSSIKGLADSDSEDDSTMSWVKRSRHQQKEKEMADKRAKMLEELDAEFGVGNLVEQELTTEKQTKYSSKDLSGLKVEHGLEKFKEGANIVLTLKDKGVLDEDEDDVLVNVNIIDDERAEKNVENKMKKPDYKPYDEPEMDEYGMLKSNEVLDKYDEEIHGAKKESFVLGSGGKYNAEHERNMDIIRQQLRQQGQSLSGPGLKLASEFLTPEEVAKQTKFKKIKKKVRRIRKKEILKADDLLPLPDQVAETTDYGSRSRGRGVIIKEEVKDESMDASGPAVEDPMPALDDDAAFYTGIMPPKQEPVMSLPPLPPLPRPPQPGPPLVDDDDDVIGPDEDLSGVVVEEESLQQELQASLSMKLRMQQKQQRKLGAQKVLETIVKLEKTEEDEDSNPSSFNASNIILNSTSEFCRSLGEIPTYGLSGNREEEREEIMDEELELMEQRRHAQEMEEQASGWAEVDIDTNPVNIVGEEKAVLEEEPIVTESIGSALKLAMKKGYLENESSLKNTCAPKHSYLQAQNYSIEDKRYDDLDEKYRKRDRYGGGMITDFKEKDGYKPEIMLEYVDDGGRALNPKEAFRQLSHRFHGKGSGKKKTEKRQKKVEEEQLMKHMSSTDTPLNTLSMLQAKQLQEKSPYVILSGNKTFSSNSTTLSKPRH